MISIVFYDVIIIIIAGRGTKLRNDQFTDANQSGRRPCPLLVEPFILFSCATNLIIPFFIFNIHSDGIDHSLAPSTP